ncbi:MAG: hydrogenase formation protein HypD [Geminicoccaceae bacterium]
MPTNRSERPALARARAWLEKIRSLPLDRTLRIMNVCGGHERLISHAGLRSLLPPQVQLVPGPGCPVCICPEEDIHQAIRWALDEDVILVSFGDMLRVPVNVPRGEPASLEAAKAAGGDVRAIASPLDALRVALDQPTRTVVFHVVGFETTLAPIAATIAQGLPENLLLLTSGRLTWPAVAMLLRSGGSTLDALIAPGHVATVMGPEEWEFVARHNGVPTAVAGFTPDGLLEAIHSVLEQALAGRPALANCYGAAVRPGGNPLARRLLDEAFNVVDAPWRGIGSIPRSGLALRVGHAEHDARVRLPLVDDTGRRRVGAMPPGCDCARVVLGAISPPECRLYGGACQPSSPVGPCMVSDEGACRIWWSTGVRERIPAPVEPV